VGSSVRFWLGGAFHSRLELVLRSAEVVIVMCFEFEIGSKCRCGSSCTALLWCRRVFLSCGPAFGGGLLRLAGLFACPRRFRSCFAADGQYVPVLAFAGMRLTLRSPGTASQARGPDSPHGISGPSPLASVATSLSQVGTTRCARKQWAVLLEFEIFFRSIASDLASVFIFRLWRVAVV
jgi:hypothetical protein